MNYAPSVPSVNVNEARFRTASLLLGSVTCKGLSGRDSIRRRVARELGTANVNPVNFNKGAAILNACLGVKGRETDNIEVMSVEPSYFIRPEITALGLWVFVCSFWLGLVG